MAKGDAKKNNKRKAPAKAASKKKQQKPEKEEAESTEEEETVVKKPVPSKKKPKKKKKKSADDESEFNNVNADYTLTMLPACGALAGNVPITFLVRSNEPAFRSGVKSWLAKQGFTKDTKEVYVEDKPKADDEEEEEEEEKKTEEKASTSLVKTPAVKKKPKLKKKPSPQFVLERGYPDRYHYEVTLRNVTFEEALGDTEYSYKSEAILALVALCEGRSSAAQRVALAAE